MQMDMMIKKTVLVTVAVMIMVVFISSKVGVGESPDCSSPVGTIIAEGEEWRISDKECL